MGYRVAVIGSGIGGLAAAVRMAALGFEVDVFEQNEVAGGKLSEIVKAGYRFDTGPSLFTLPDQINELYALCGIPIKDNLNYRQLDVVCRYFYNDKLFIDSFSDPARFAGEVEEKTGEPAANVLRFLKRSSVIYDLTRDVFIFRSFHDRTTFLSKGFLKATANWWKLDPLSTMNKSTERAFNSDEVRKLFNRYATYNGSNPYEAPATLNVISHLEHNLGAFFPDRGMYQIIRSLLELMDKKGIRLHLNTKVEKVVVTSNRVNGILVNGKELAYDLVISDMDVYSFYRTLMYDQKMLDRLGKQELSTSAIVFYWGISRSFPQLKLHNILFAEDYRAEFDHIWKLKKIYHNPTVYIFISSKHVETDAPEGCENWFVMINTHASTSLGEPEIVRQVRHDIIKKINRFLRTNIEEAIACESVNTPRTLEQKTLSYQGAIYGPSSNNKFAAFNRHPNFRKKTRGLYFTGGSVHPGGGIPLCLASAKIVEERVRKDFKINKNSNDKN